MSFKETVTASPSSSEVVNRVTVAPADTPAPSVKAGAASATESVGASFAAVTVGLTVAAVPFSVPSFGVRVKVGKSVPALTKFSPACVKLTRPSPNK